LDAELALVVSNHPDLRPLALAAGLGFEYVPVTAETKAQAEGRLLELGPVPGSDHYFGIRRWRAAGPVVVVEGGAW
jgi:formyltetrahydrofolate deformylase